MKQYLNSRDIGFRSLDITNKENARKAFELTGKRTFPVTVIGSETVVGYDTAAVDRALHSQMY